MGLLRIPQPWVPDFFVVSADKAPTVSAILAAGRTVGIQNLSNVYVRSSGTLEGIEERGSLESRTCALVDVPELVARLKADLAARGELRKQSVQDRKSTRLNSSH